MKENWLLEIGSALSARDACEQAEQIARDRGYKVVSSKVEVQRHPLRDKLSTVITPGSFWVRLMVIER